MFVIPSHQRTDAPNDLEIVGVVSKHRHDVQNDIRSFADCLCRWRRATTAKFILHVRLNTQDRHAVVAIMPTLRQSLREIDPDLPLLQMTPLRRSDGEIAQSLDR